VVEEIASGVCVAEDEWGGGTGDMMDDVFVAAIDGIVTTECSEVGDVLIDLFIAT
jgi:hypothetical protein